jgi:hypothetical protein
MAQELDVMESKILLRFKFFLFFPCYAICI